MNLFLFYKSFMQWSYFLYRENSYVYITITRKTLLLNLAGYENIVDNRNISLWS